MRTTPSLVPLGSSVHRTPPVRNQAHSAPVSVPKASSAPLPPAFLTCATSGNTVHWEAQHLSTVLRALWGQGTISPVQTSASRVLGGRVVSLEAPLLNPAPLASILRMQAVLRARVALLERIRTRKGRPSASPAHKVITVPKRRGHPSLVRLVVGVMSSGYPLRSNAKAVRSAPTVQKPPRSLAVVPKAPQVRSRSSQTSASVPIVSHRKAVHQAARNATCAFQTTTRLPQTPHSSAKTVCLGLPVARTPRSPL
mmetsp:Transcript_74491/g.205334  ORF Transcript_74491/g.205334 Transcript_74491/m.205334 type:complete len:254 (-) Transcript_74491:1056-1817(-)